MANKVLFCGFGRLGLECLKELIKEGYNVLGILTHKENEEYSVDTFAETNNIKYFYSDTRKEKDCLLDVIGDKKIDYIISINYRYIIPQEVFSLANYAINIHGSLLPKYRGRTPHVWSIINGEKYSGVTCHLIDQGVDTGNIIEQVRVKISKEDTGYSLLTKFQEIYPSLLINSLKGLQAGITITEQDEQEASYYGKRTPDMGYIDFYKTKEQIVNFVRAQSHPYPGAYYYLTSGKRITINSLESVDPVDILPNQIGIITFVGDAYYVKCVDGVLKLLEFKISD